MASSATRWSRFRPAAFLVAALIVIGVSAFAFQHVWRENGLRALQAIKQPPIEVIANAVRAEINRQDHLPIVLSLDADVRNALAVPQDRGRLDDVSHKLHRINPEADTGALM